MSGTAYMEMIYLDSDDNGRHTDVGAAMSCDEATKAAFDSYRYLEVPKADARFLLDFYTDDNDLADTILLDNAGFTTITGQAPKSDAEYRRIDDSYWKDARKEYEASKAERR